MRLGIDFGTTRTVVAMVDRGNYPVVGFTDTDGDVVDFFPTVVAATPRGLVFGFDALAASRDGAPLLRSFKRHLADPGASFEQPLSVGGHSTTLSEVMRGFASALALALRTSATLTLPDDEPLEAVLGVPAHAPTGQRMLTLDAFRHGGFEVLGMMHEPSAAAFEYTHRYPKTITSKRSDVIVYDLGGGTFDASLVRVEGREHRILTSVGDARLGGDDFDEVLADLARQAAGGSASTHTPALLDEVRATKERIAPQTRRLVVDVDGLDVTVSVDDFYRAAGPLMAASLDVMSPLMAGDRLEVTSEEELAGIYLVGGASGLPLVPRTLRERFGRRVHRSPHPSASTAIGLAIAADPDSGFRLFDRLTRGVGVFREADAGGSIVFDLVVSGATRLPDSGGELVITRCYRAAHDLGRFRFVEVSGVDEQGAPTGDIAPFAAVDMPFDTALRDGRDLADHEPRRRNGGPLVEERYAIDANRVVTITITDLVSGFTVEARTAVS